MEYKNINNIDELAEKFRINYPVLTLFQSVELAIQEQRNQILRAAYVVSANDTHPSALENIAMLLRDEGISGALADIEDKLSEIDGSLQDE